MLKILLLIYISMSARAQNVTASFDSSAVGENPAAAATRDIGIITPFASMTDVQQSVTDPFKNGSTEVSSRKIHLNRFESVLAINGKALVPELYLSQNQGTTTVHSNGQDSTTKMGLFNNQLNLAWHTTQSLKLGVIAFYPQVSFENAGSFTDSKNNASTYNVTGRQSDLGLGAGATYFLTSNFAIAGVYTTVGESNSDSGTVTTGSTSTPVETSTSLNHKKYGIGMSYQIGTSKSGGFRIEISHFEIQWDNGTSGAPVTAEETPVLGFFGRNNNSQNQIAIEATTLGLTGGVNFTQTCGTYLNYRYLADSLFDEPSNTPGRTANTFGGFLGFKSTSGRSFGVRASYFAGSTNINFLGAETVADVTRTTFGASYAYAF